MSVVEKNYKVEFLDNIEPPNDPIDITEYVVSLDDFNIQSTGIISDAKLTINGEFGQFISNSNGNTTPILTQFERLRITILDDDGNPQSNRIMQITTDLAQIAPQSSYLLPLELEGRERYLSGIPFGGIFRDATHKEMALNILLAVGRQNGSLQPIVAFDNNDLPDFNPNIWDFTHVDNCFDAFMEVVRHANLPVSAGGGGNRYAVIFEDDVSFPLSILRINIIKQGENNVAPFPVLEQNADHPIIAIDKVKSPSTGSIVIARGRPGTGTQPSNISEFISKLEFYRAIKTYDSTIEYPQGSYVTHKGIKYQANSPVPLGTDPPSGAWSVIDVGDYIGTFQYSPFTHNKATGPIKNGFANPTGGFDPDDFDSVAIPDHNMVIRDSHTNREMVLFRTNTTDITGDTYLNKYLFNETDFVEGTVVLVDTSLGGIGGDFAADNYGTGAGNDPNGLPYADNIAEFRIPPLSAPSLGRWFVTRVTEDYDQVSVYAEGRVFEYNVAFDPADRIYPGSDRRRGGLAGPQPFAWRDVSNAFLGNDCFHTPLSIEITDGLFGNTIEKDEPLNDQFGNPYKSNSAVKIVYGYSQDVERPEEQDVWVKLYHLVKTPLLGIAPFLADLTLQTFTTFTTPNYTNLGWWFAWPSPYPLSTHNGIIEEIGELYGGDVNTLNRHRYFDMFNIRYTTSGKEGWIHSDSKDLSEVTGVEFLFNFDITASSVRIPFTGDLPFVYWVMDDRGTLWRSQKKLYRHLGETQKMTFEFGDLSPVFRARTPLGLNNVLENIIVPELESNEQLFKDRILMQGFMWDAPYDKFGRYSPNLFEQIIKPTFFNFFQGGAGTIKFEGIIDSFGFTKSPVAISAPTVFSGERTIIPNIEEYQNIVNTEQLQRFTDAQAQVESFQYEQYTVKQGGIDDFELEDTISLKDPFFIKESDSGPNTRDLAVRELHFSAMKGEALIRRAVLVKKIE